MTASSERPEWPLSKMFDPTVSNSKFVTNAAGPHWVLLEYDVSQVFVHSVFAVSYSSCGGLIVTVGNDGTTPFEGEAQF